MKLVLLVSTKTTVEKDWSLAQEVSGAWKGCKEATWLPDGVIPIGRDAFLFEQTSAFGRFAQACAHLTRNDWPYIVAYVDRNDLLVDGTCFEGLKAILGR